MQEPTLAEIIQRLRNCKLITVGELEMLSRTSEYGSLTIEEISKIISLYRKYFAPVQR